MKNIIISFCILIQASILAQVPSIIHSPEVALENVESQVLEATIDDMEKLFSCSFEKDSTLYELNFLSSGQEDVFIELQSGESNYSYTAGRTITKYNRAAVKHDYSSQTYDYFMKNLIVNFLNNGSSQVYMNFNSSCEGEEGHSDTNWLDTSAQGFHQSEIDIELFASARQRTMAGQCLATVGCALSEGWELTSQSWRYMNDAEGFTDWGNRMLISEMMGAVSLNLAGKYDEALSGKITIDGQSYSMTCGDEFLPHFYKSIKK